MRILAATAAAAILGQWAFGGMLAPALAGPKVLLGRAVPAGERISIDRISHAAWNELLARYVDGSGMVAYTAWKAAQGDVQRLDEYLDELSRASTTAPSARAAQLAYWINAYNALTVKGILREYPTTSIRNHTPKLFGYHIWHDLLLRVDGRTCSLTQIEHDVLRKMGDPRIHFAIVCASRGCPRLLDEAYAAEALHEQLDRNARDFFARRTNFQYEAASRTIRLSHILELFGKDFGATTPEQLRRIAPYLPDAVARKLAVSGEARVLYLDYDWRLNDQAGGR